MELTTRSKYFSSGLRIYLSDLDILNLSRSDFVAFSIVAKNKSKVNLKFFTEKNARREYMFYSISEIIERFESIKVPKYRATVILNPASINIEWLSILTLLEPGDEIEFLWCLDWEINPFLEATGLHYDCVRIVIHKPDHRQYHIRLHTTVGDENNRLIKSYS